MLFLHLKNQQVSIFDFVKSNLLFVDINVYINKFEIVCHNNNNTQEQEEIPLKLNYYGSTQVVRPLITYAKLN